MAADRFRNQKKCHVTAAGPPPKGEPSAGSRTHTHSYCTGTTLHTQIASRWREAMKGGIGEPSLLD